MKFITITNPDGAKVRINIAHIIFYQKYNHTVINMVGTQILVVGQYDELQFAQESVEMIDGVIDQVTNHQPIPAGE